METIENISMREIGNFVNRMGYLIIDLRSQRDYKEFHIETAVNIPYESIANGEVELPNNKILVLYCQHGGVSIVAAKRLMKKGYRVINTIGGMSAYEKNIK